MNSKLSISALLAGLALCGQLAHATQIDGSINIAGGAIANGPANTATAFNSFNLATVVNESGDYLAVPLGTPVTITPFAFNPGLPVPSLWNFSVGAVNYSFDLGSIGIQAGGQGIDPVSHLAFLHLCGIGTAHITGFDDTTASFIMDANGVQGNILLAFGNTTSANPTPVSDGGSTLVLIGTALTAIGAVRRKGA